MDQSKQNDPDQPEGSSSGYQGCAHSGPPYIEGGVRSRDHNARREGAGRQTTRHTNCCPGSSEQPDAQIDQYQAAGKVYGRLHTGRDDSMREAQIKDRYDGYLNNSMPCCNAGAGMPVAIAFGNGSCGDRPGQHNAA